MTLDLIRPDDFELMQRIGSSLIASAFFPTSANSKEQSIAQACVKIMAGRELGLPPVASMMGVNVIQGRVSLSAQLMLACAKRAGYGYDVHEADGWCSIDWYRAADGKLLGKSSFSMDEAKEAGLVKQGGNWTKYPSDMLFWRAASRGVRRFCPDATSGMAVYAPDELGVEVDPEDSAPSPIQGSREAQAEVLRGKLIEAGMSEEQAAAESAKVVQPRGKKTGPRPVTALEITDDDLPPELRADPTDRELDLLFAKEETGGSTAKALK
jgi:hypothetical protein